MSESTFDPVLGRVPSGIFIMTVSHESDSTGMLASWVMQAGFEPPMITVAVKNGRYVEDWLNAGAPFVLNVVSQEDKTMLKHFGKGFEPGVPAFEGLDTENSSHGVPVLKSTLGYLECEPAGQVASGDHTVFLAKVIGGKLLNEEKPMVHIRKSGAKY